jgi:structural maintenance of chromosome 1
MREETQGFVEELARLTSASGSAAAEARSRQQHRITALHTKLAVAQDEVARLQSEIGLYTARVAVLRADLEKKKRPELAAAQRAVDAAASELAGAEKQATSIAAERFKGFVKAQKAASLEQWEQTQLRAAQAARETAGKFTVQVSRLEAQIAYERARAAEDAAPAETLAKRAKAAQRDHDEAVKALHKLDDVITGHETALAKLGDAFKRAEEAVAARFAVFKAGRAALEAAEADVALVRKELSLVQLRHSGVIAARNELLRKAVMEQAVLPLTRLKKNGTAAAAAGTGPGRKGKRRASDAASPSKRARRPAGSYDDGSDDEEEEEEDDEGNDDGRSGRSSRGGVGRGAAMTDVMSQSLPFSMSDADPSSSAGSGAGTGSSSGTQPETEIGSAFAGTLAPTDVLIDYANLPIEDSISGLTTAAEVEELRGHYQLRLQQMWAEIESASPNARATEHEADLADRVRATATLFAEKQQAQKRAAEEYEAVKATRRKLFLDAFNAISATIDPIYKILSASVGPGGEQLAGGRAELTLENPDEPYKSGIVYSATPPQKRFRDVSQLSGGEKTMAALALLFAIHSYRYVLWLFFRVLYLEVCLCISTLFLTCPPFMSTCTFYVVGARHSSYWTRSTPRWTSTTSRASPPTSAPARRAPCRASRAPLPASARGVARPRAMRRCSASSSR